MNGRTVRWLLSRVLRGGDPRRGPARLTIVRHHRVFADGERPLYRLGVSASAFEAQLGTLVSAGLTPLTVSEGLARLASGAPGRCVAFSFDDGYADNVELALPALRRHGARATFFLTAGLMDERRAPWWDELVFVLEGSHAPRLRVGLGEGALDLATDSVADRAVSLARLLPWMRVTPAEQRSRLAQLREAARVREPAPCELADWPRAAHLAQAGMELGAHTLTHPYLTTLPGDEQEREIRDSAARIRDRLGAAVAGLAYPNGDHDATTLARARVAGLSWAVTTARGDVARGDERFALRRRALTDGACTAPSGAYSASMTLAEVGGAFDRLRGAGAEVAS